MIPSRVQNCNPRALVGLLVGSGVLKLRVPMGSPDMLAALHCLRCVPMCSESHRATTEVSEASHSCLSTRRDARSTQPLAERMTLLPVAHARKGLALLSLARWSVPTGACTYPQTWDLHHVVVSSFGADARCIERVRILLGQLAVDGFESF